MPHETPPSPEITPAQEKLNEALAILDGRLLKWIDFTRVPEDMDSLPRERVETTGERFDDAIAEEYLMLKEGKVSVEEIKIKCPNLLAFLSDLSARTDKDINDLFREDLAFDSDLSPEQRKKLKDIAFIENGVESFGERQAIFTEQVATAYGALCQAAYPELGLPATADPYLWYTAHIEPFLQQRFADRTEWVSALFRSVTIDVQSAHGAPLKDKDLLVAESAVFRILLRIFEEIATKSADVATLHFDDPSKEPTDDTQNLNRISAALAIAAALAKLHIQGNGGSDGK
jgi:hypothetical protein